MPRLNLQPGRRDWETEEILRLREIAGKVELEDIAAEMKRSASSIKGMASKMGYKLRVTKQKAEA
jgi:Mn-dependent DtxR family transcriptional regulator